jgi:heme/copper-type cytochrome/quinol oxidase subunit 2
MRATVIILAGLLAACAAGTDDVAVTTAPPTTVANVSTTSTSPVETTTTTAATTTTTEATTTTTIPAGLIEVTVSGEEVTVDGPVAVPLGEEVTIRVTSDVADQVHVHTYDLFAELEPGTPSEVTFTAEIPGIHEVEMEGSGLLLLNLEVGG